MKTSYLYLLTSLILFSFASCKIEEDNIFSESAAVRLNNAKADYKKILCSASNGWVMEYFPTDATEGYTFLMKFNESGAVSIAAKNKNTDNSYKTENSLYEIIADNAPVLTFNTYNSIFSFYANPENPTGYGYGGDYEFIVLHADSNEVKLKGKKRGTYIFLHKLDDNASWQGYFAKLEIVNRAITNANVNFLNLIVATDTLKAYQGNTGIFAFLEKGGDFIADKKFAAFIITSYGLRFHTEQNYYGKKFQDFALSADSARLVSKTDNAIYFHAPVLNNYLKASTSTWKIDTTRTSSNFKTRLQALQAALKKGYSTKKFEYFGIANKTTYANAFVIKLSSTEGTYRIDFSEKPNNIVEIALPTTTVNLYDNNGKAFYNKTTEVATTLSYFCGEYKVSSSTPLTINSVRYERSNNSNEYFTMSR